MSIHSLAVVRARTGSTGRKRVSGRYTSDTSSHLHASECALSKALESAVPLSTMWLKQESEEARSEFDLNFEQNVFTLSKTEQKRKAKIGI